MRAVIYMHKTEPMDAQQRRRAGQQWLYQAVARYGYPEITAATCPVLRTEAGKPYFGDRPEVHFSISHSRDYWACAVADGPVGLDLQYHKAGRLDNIPQRFFHPEETAWLRAQGLGALSEADGTDCWEGQKDRGAFFDVWAAKESYVKWTGQGIDRYFRQFCVVNEQGLAECCGEAFFWRQRIEEEYSLCLCGGEPWDDVRICYEDWIVSDAGDGR